MQLELERFFDAQSIARGATYAREGRVVKLQGPSPTVELTASVLGSDLYEVELKLTFDASLRLTRVKGTCSCPAGALCNIWQQCS